MHTLAAHILKRFSLVACLLFLTLSGCSTSSDFHIKNLAKTDIDTVTEIHLHQTTELLKILTQKLYKKNPAELAKVPGQTIASRMEQIFTCPVYKIYEELELKTGTDAILLGFEPGFQGDRIFSIMFGLYSMVHKAYNSKCEFYIMDVLNEQNLYNCARNIEILVWRLKTRQTDSGRPLIITNSLDPSEPNLSYERIFGKLIALQDTMALIVSNRTGRVIKEAVQIAGMAFLPIGI